MSHLDEVILYTYIKTLYDENKYKEYGVKQKSK